MCLLGNGKGRAKSKSSPGDLVAMSLKKHLRLFTGVSTAQHSLEPFEALGCELGYT